ncbi:MAG: AAA family ATPase [Candidatus Poseidoniales archaeon]
MEQPALTLLLLRGPSCSGKSSFIEHELRHIAPKSVYSTDDFFLIDGEYIFDKNRLPQYHEMNVRRCLTSMESLEPFIIIDNTHLQIWEMCPYVQAALKHGYHIQIQSMPKLPLEILLKRNLERGKTGKFIPPEVLGHHHSIYNDEIALEDIIKFCEEANN